MEDGIIESIREAARRLLPAHGSHGFEHTERIYRTCLHIGGKAGADTSILIPAALLHDVGRGCGDHAIESSEMARRILSGMNFERERIDAVVEAISTHSYSGGRSPESLEAKILSDADKLDAMGALGVYRAAMYSCEHARQMEDFIAHFDEKLLTLRDTLFTDEAKRLAEIRHRFMLRFLAQLDKELRLDS